MLFRSAFLLTVSSASAEIPDEGMEQTGLLQTRSREHLQALEIKETAVSLGRGSSGESGAMDETALVSATPLPCSTETDDDVAMVASSLPMDIKLAYGCLEIKSWCNNIEVKKICPETCGVSCPDCSEVFQCDWGMLTTVVRKEINGRWCDEVKCTQIKDKTKEKCPWMVGTTDSDYVFECVDGQTCNAKTGPDEDGNDTYDWDCCNDHEGRSKCPKNYPYMCNEACPVCDPEGVEFRCEKVSCNAHGGYRPCVKARNDYCKGQGDNKGCNGQGQGGKEWVRRLLQGLRARRQQKEQKESLQQAQDATKDSE